MFGYILNASNIKIYDLSLTHLNIFYHTVLNKISTCNFDDYVINWKQKPYLNEKFKLPIFIPVQIIENYINYYNDIEYMKKYLILDEDFIIKIKSSSNI